MEKLPRRRPQGHIDMATKAKTSFESEFVSAPLYGGEVARIHNRIDNLELGTERAIRYTYSESDVWPKHPAAYKVVVDLFSGSTSGRHGTRDGGGQGGYSGGWKHAEFTGDALDDLPAAVAVTIAAGTEAGNDGPAGTSSFGSFVTTRGATATNYGEGERTYKMRGGHGMFNGAGGSDGNSGPYAPGGSLGRTSSAATAGGGHGFSVDVGQVGPGSAGGGGGNYRVDLAWASGPGGHGGWPAGPGGGGAGSSWPFVDFTREGGNGAGGAAIITVYVSDDLGQPPTAPTNLAATSITRTSARITWAASVDDVMVKNYILYLDGSRYGVVTTTFHDLAGLAAGTSYTVRVQAVDIGDNVSELSAPLTFTTTT